MADSQVFRLRDGVTISGIGREVEGFLRHEKDLFVEGIESPDGYLVQAREQSTWKKITGLGKALQVQIIPSGTTDVLVKICEELKCDISDICEIVTDEALDD